MILEIRTHRLDSGTQTDSAISYEWLRPVLKNGRLEHIPWLFDPWIESEDSCG